MIQSQHYGFFNNACNNVFASIEHAYLISSTTPGCGTRPKGPGTYMYPNNIRHCIALYCVRSIPKHSWVNDSNVYIGRGVENDTK